MRMPIRLKTFAAFAIPLIFAVRANAIPLDPADFESFRSLRASTGSLIINTDGLEPRLRMGTEEFKGILVSQGGDLPDVAVFTFDDIHLTGSVTISGSGSRPLALLSKGGVVITPTITLSGGNGGPSGTAAAGAWGGAAPGAGPGVGLEADGGGFGGRGGVAGGPLFREGGSAYGDLTIALQGGSGGGLGHFGVSGGGGGAIAIGALGTVSVGNIIANGGAGAPVPRAGVSDAGGSGGAILLRGTTVSAGSLQARGGSAGDTTVFAGGGGGGRILVAVDTFALGGPPLRGDVSGGIGGQGQFSGKNGERGVFDLRAALAVVGSGEVFTPDADGRMALRDGASLIAKDVVLRSGAAAVASHPYVTSGLLSLESGSAFTAVSTFRVDHLVSIASGSGFTAIGRTTASAPIVLGGGTFSAIGGLSTGSRLEGHGAVVGAVHGTAGSGLIVSGGTLTMGDANRADGVDWQGGMTIQSSTAAAATLQLNSADTIALPDMALFGNGARLATLNGSQLAAGRTITADAASRISGAFRNNGLVFGPTDGQAFLVFDDAVTGVGSYGGNVRFAGGFSPGASPALVSAGTLAFDAGNTLRMELGGRLRGTGYDAIDADGTITLGGTLEVVLLAVDGGLFAPGLGDTFDLLRAAHIDGSFAAEVLPTIDAGLQWRTSIFADGGSTVFRLSVAAVPEPQTVVLLASGLVLVAGLARRRGGR